MKIAVIGAGFGGLAAAYDLVRAGHAVTVYEAAAKPGGLASGFSEPHWDWTVEKFYHHWFESDRHMLGLIEELGLEGRVLFPRPQTVMYHQGQFYPFDSIPAAIMFPGLGWGIRKIRFGLVGLYLRLTNNWQQLEKVTAHEWMRKWVGESVYETMWKPLLVGKFGSYYDQVNMAWFWARLKARSTRLGTYEGGFQAFANSFADHLEAQESYFDTTRRSTGSRRPARAGCRYTNRAKAPTTTRCWSRSLPASSPGSPRPAGALPGWPADAEAHGGGRNDPGVETAAF